MRGRLREIGAQLEYSRVDGIFHDFQVLGDYLEVSRDALAGAARAIDGFFASVAPGGAVESAAKG